MRGRAVSFVSCLALVALSGTVAPADPPVVLNPLPALHWDGQALRNPAGQAVTLRGLNVVYKHGPQYLPDPAGSTITADSLNEADAALIASWGFNVVRLGLFWAGVQPEKPPADFDHAYIARARMIVQTLADHGIYTLLDFHQDVFNGRYGGEGAPDWAVQSPLPPTNSENWGQNYFTPAVMNEYDLFWSNAGGVADEYARAWTAVAEAFADETSVIGYDLFNEPWPGTQWPTCANPLGCPVFDEVFLQAFYQKVLNAIRTVDTNHMIYFSPAIPTNFGAATMVGPLSDPASMPAVRPPQTGLSFHVYCLEGALDGSFSGQGASCATLEERAMQVQAQWARDIGVHPILSEFGASDDLIDVERVAELAEGNGADSWIYWAYKQFDDPTGSPTESVLDPDTLAPKTAKLHVLARPYARLIAGGDVMQDWNPDPLLRTLQVWYTANGGTTEIVWPVAIQGSYAAGCVPSGVCAIASTGDTITVDAPAGTNVIVAVSKL